MVFAQGREVSIIFAQDLVVSIVFVQILEVSIAILQTQEFLSSGRKFIFLSSYSTKIHLFLA